MKELKYGPLISFAVLADGYNWVGTWSLWSRPSIKRELSYDVIKVIFNQWKLEIMEGDYTAISSFTKKKTC